MSIHSPFIVPDLSVIVGDETETIGFGSFGQVYETESGYAVKNFHGQELTKDVLNEVAILRYLQHPNILSPIAMQMNPIKIAFPLAVTDINEMGSQELTFRKSMFYQIFRGVNYMHSKQVWHLDLKELNILLFERPDDIWVVKIADFGSSVFYPRAGYVPAHTTRYWKAPELLLRDRNFDWRVDIWALGITMLNIINQTLTFEGLSEEEMIMPIVRMLGTPTEQEYSRFSELTRNETKYQGIPPSFQWSAYDPLEVEVLQSCLAWPAVRKSAAEILKLPYFDEVRLIVEKFIPTEPVKPQTCADQMIKNQQSLSAAEEGSAARRQALMWLWDTSDLLDTYSRSILPYALTLFDLVQDRQKIADQDHIKYAAACFWLGTNYKFYETLIIEYLGDLKGVGAFDNLNLQKPEVGPFDDLTIQNPEPSDFIDSDSKSYTLQFTKEEEFTQTANDILRSMDFKMVFPTIDDFVSEYYPAPTAEERSQLYQIEFLLYLHAEYVRTYTPAQLAQICLEALGLSSDCLPSTQLYHTGIRDQLLRTLNELKSTLTPALTLQI